MVNGKACVCVRDGQDKTAQPLRQPRSKQKLLCPWLFSFLFHQYNTYSQEHKRQAENTDTQPQRYVAEKMGGQRNGTDGFAQVREIFGEQILGLRLDDFHDSFRDRGVDVDYYTNNKLIIHQVFFHVQKDQADEEQYTI